MGFELQKSIQAVEGSIISCAYCSTKPKDFSYFPNDFKKPALKKMMFLVFLVAFSDNGEHSKKLTLKIQFLSFEGV